jgi:hypothetical protein
MCSKSHDAAGGQPAWRRVCQAGGQHCFPTNMALWYLRQLMNATSYDSNTILQLQKQILGLGLEQRVGWHVYNLHTMHSMRYATV